MTRQQTTHARDQWARWLLETRFGGDPQIAEEFMRRLSEVRDRVLDGAAITGGETLLDVGCGDGLIAFGALDRIGPNGRVIFSDISQDLLGHTRRLAEEAGLADRCAWIRTPAESLEAIEDASVDVVTTRSVLIFVKDKARAFREFCRVLKPGGRISLFEPINRFEATYRDGDGWMAMGVPEVADLAARLRAYFRQLQPDDDPMLDFDERDLLRQCEDAGFTSIHVALHITVGPRPPARWDAVKQIVGNPKIPSMAEAMQRIFTREEITRFEAHVRSAVEAGGTTHRTAVAYVTAARPARTTKPVNGRGAE